jgi:nicotinic acid mononucleotide adenylyltransferase
MQRPLPWKIARDPYLASLCQKHGESAAYEAGFFLDDDPEDAPLDDLAWLCTPRPKLSAWDDAPVVLLSTGGFCPIHRGHLAMMERARSAASAAGLSVIGGYLSPGHDAYLRMKCGDAAIPIRERLRLCARAVSDSAWLSIDPWEALHRRVAVNYTDVCARLEAYLQKHVHPRLEVVFVCGGDNARFATAFSERGRCIVVDRPGAEAEFARFRAQLSPHPRILFAPGGHAESSRDLRPARAVALPRARLVLRREDARAAHSLGLERLDAFQDELLSILTRYAEVRSVRLDPRAPEDDAISLDPMLPARHNLALSRLYAMGGYELLGFVPRPGSAPLTEQVARIPAGRYTLRDDDYVTGGTLRMVESLLPPSVQIAHRVFALTRDHDEDVLDARDFLLGAEHGGLVLSLPDGRVGRAPYLLPYVDPAARASIAHSHAFSREVWQLNARLFSSTDLCTRDLPAYARETFAAFGDARLEDVCSFHGERLRYLCELGTFRDA